MPLATRTEVSVSFGDCDPAGIVFYPHFFRWVDHAFHDLLHQFGGHVAVCKRLDALGIGVISAQSRFLRPARDGDMLVYTPQIADWREKQIELAYQVTRGGELVAEVSEARGIFRQGERGIFTAHTSGLRSMVEQFERG